MSTKIKSMLKQLTREELFKLARKKKARIKKTLPKSEIVKLLTPIVREKDIKELLVKKGRTGLRAYMDGREFERKISNYFARQGYSCRLNVRKRYVEYDIIGYAEERGFLRTKVYWLLAECKNVPKVTVKDLDKFIGKFERFRRKHEGDEVIGYLVTSGVFAPEVKKAARDYPDIKLKRIR